MSEMNLDAFGKELVEPYSLKNRKPSRNQLIAGVSDEDQHATDSIELVQWSICGPQTYKPVSVTFPELNRGIYNILTTEQHGLVFQKKDIFVDDLLRFPDSLSDKILGEITTFWGKSEKFKEHGF